MFNKFALLKSLFLLEPNNFSLNSPLHLLKQNCLTDSNPLTLKYFATLAKISRLLCFEIFSFRAPRESALDFTNVCDDISLLC